MTRYAAAFAAGATEPDPSAYYDRAWSTADLCRLFGVWNAKFG